MGFGQINKRKSTPLGRFRPNLLVQLFKILLAPSEKCNFIEVPFLEVFHVNVENRCAEKRQDLRHDESSHDAKPEWLTG